MWVYRRSLHTDFAITSKSAVRSRSRQKQAECGFRKVKNKTTMVTSSAFLRIRVESGLISQSGWLSQLCSACVKGKELFRWNSESWSKTSVWTTSERSLVWLTVAKAVRWSTAVVTAGETLTRLRRSSKLRGERGTSPVRTLGSTLLNSCWVRAWDKGRKLHYKGTIPLCSCHKLLARVPVQLEVLQSGSSMGEFSANTSAVRGLHEYDQANNIVSVFSLFVGAFSSFPATGALKIASGGWWFP